MEIINSLIQAVSDWLSHVVGVLESHDGAITAIATVFIAAFTYTLFKVTKQLKIIGERQAKALTDLERPWLFMEATHIERREGAPIQPELHNNWWISFKWRNVGRAPAVIESCIFKIEPTDLLPESPDYSSTSELGCPSTVAKDAEFETRKVGPGEEIRVRDGEPVNLTVYGKLTYKELNGAIHNTGFAIDVSPALPAVNTNKNKEYEFFD